MPDQLIFFIWSVFCLYFTSCFTSVPGQWSTVCLYLVSGLSVSGQLFGCTWSAVCMYHCTWSVVCLVSCLSVPGQLFFCTWSAVCPYLVSCLSAPCQSLSVPGQRFVCTLSAVCLYLVSRLSVPGQLFVWRHLQVDWGAEAVGELIGLLAVNIVSKSWEENS